MPTRARKQPKPAPRRATKTPAKAKARPTKTAKAAKASRAKKPAKPPASGGKVAFPFFAIEEGRLKEVMAYLAAGGDINACPSGALRPLLSEAAAHGNLKLVKELLAQGADPNGLGATGESPLQEAAEFGLDEIVKVLLEHGAQASYRDPGGKTALHNAARCCRVAGKREWRPLPPPKKARVIKLLIDAGVDPRIEENGGRTAWFFAVDCENREGLELLPEDVPSSKVAGGDTSPEDEQLEQAHYERRMTSFLSRTVKALKAARNDPGKLATAITKYLEEGDAIGCSPSELWDYFGISTPSLPAKARFTKQEEERAIKLFAQLTKERYRG